MLGRELLQVETDLIISDLKPFKEYNDIMCECGREKAKYKVYDEFMKGWSNSLCPECFEEEIKEYDKESTSYEFELLK